jgi:hypothetical protein
LSRSWMPFRNNRRRYSITNTWLNCWQRQQFTGSGLSFRNGNPFISSMWQTSPISISTTA